MNIFKKILSTIGHLLLSIVRVLRRAVCCRKKKDDFILPMTVDQVNNSESQKVNDMYDLQPHWDAWPEVGNSSSSPNGSGAHDKVQGQIFHQEENIDDFFKDMVPQIRKPKKLYIRTDEVTEETYSSNRLAMDPKAILSGPDLGIIEDNPSNWEDIEDSGELWDADELIRETKRAEREKRLAEHQRRKQERESRRARQDSSSNSAILNLSDSRDKAKSS